VVFYLLCALSPLECVHRSPLRGSRLMTWGAARWCATPLIVPPMASSSHPAMHQDSMVRSAWPSTSHLLLWGPASTSTRTSIWLLKRARVCVEPEQPNDRMLLKPYDPCCVVSSVFCSDWRELGVRTARPQQRLCGAAVQPRLPRDVGLARGPAAKVRAGGA
jgi:hypothetical protein